VTKVGRVTLLGGWKGACGVRVRKEEKG